MKTLIVYGSKYGFAKDCAEKLAQQLNGDVTCVNAADGTVPPIREFDNVIVGGSIYMGQIQKEVKEYCNAHTEELCGKRIGLFLCCGLPENLEQEIKGSFPEKLLEKAIAVENFGGELRMEKMKLMHKMITKMMMKVAEKEGKEPPKALPENISKLAAVMNDI